MEKSQKIGIAKLRLLRATKLIIFGFKIYPFILRNNKENFIKEIYEYALSTNRDYKPFVKYFKKNWEFSNFLDFDIISNAELYNRTNNYVEAFHNKLNTSIEISHPRVSILVGKLVEFSIEYYYSYIQKLFIEDNSKNNPVNIYNDIFNFLTKFTKKYNYEMNFKLVMQDDGDTKANYENITKRIITKLYNVDDNLLNQNAENSDEINKFEDDEKGILNNGLEENWWFNYNKEEKILTNKNDEEIDPFIVDNCLNYKAKINYNSIKNEIIEKLYNNSKK